MLRFLLCVLGVVSLWPLGAMAQGTMPGYTVMDLGPLNLNQGEKVDRDPKEAFDGIRNTRMKSVLELQNQITMLNALTNWQSQVTKMEETYLRAGIPFTAPNPPRNICEQVPPNSVCSEAYSDMKMPEDAAKAKAKKDESEATKEAVKEEKAPVVYEWADIRCMSQDCTATIIDTATGMRVTGREGEIIADGVIVQDVNPMGVRVTIDGVGTDLDPSEAPAVKAPPAMATPAVAAGGAKNELQALLDGTPGGANAKPVPGAPPMTQQPIVLDDGSGATTTTTTTTTTNAPAPASPLGPTGLF